MRHFHHRYIARAAALVPALCTAVLAACSPTAGWDGDLARELDISVSRVRLVRGENGPELFAAVSIATADASSRSRCEARALEIQRWLAARYGDEQPLARVTVVIENETYTRMPTQGIYQRSGAYLRKYGTRGDASPRRDPLVDGETASPPELLTPSLDPNATPTARDHPTPPR